MQSEIGHLAARNASRAFDEVSMVVLTDYQLREGDAVTKPESVHCRNGGLLGLCQRVREEPRRIDMNPADSEADPRRAQAIRQRQGRDPAGPRDREPVQLDPLVVALDDRLLARRLGQRGMEMRLEVLDRVEPEDAALASGIRGLQHSREPDGLGGRIGLVQRAGGREPRLRHPCLGQAPPHRHLVRHQMGGVGSDSRQPERLGDRGDHGNRAVGGDGENPVDCMAPPCLGDRGDVHEVDNLGQVGLAVSVDRDHAQAELPRPPDRAPLVPARADEENGPVHTFRTVVDVLNDFALSAGSSRPHGQSPHGL